MKTVKMLVQLVRFIRSISWYRNVHKEWRSKFDFSRPVDKKQGFYQDQHIQDPPDWIRSPCSDVTLATRAGIEGRQTLPFSISISSQACSGGILSHTYILILVRIIYISKNHVRKAIWTNRYRRNNQNKTFFLPSHIILTHTINNNE